MNSFTPSSVASSSSPSSSCSSSAWALRESRRGSSRREVVLPCQAVREHDFKLIADRTLDISIDGLLLPLRTRVLTGESLIVSFAIPGGMWIDVEATVARVVHNRRPGDDGLAVGVVFDHIAPSARAALAGFLHGRRAPLPRRGPLARLRRGQLPPQLADESLMLQALPSKDEGFIDDADVVLEETPCVPGVVANGKSGGIDGLGVLRAVVGAWQSLSSSNG